MEQERSEEGKTPNNREESVGFSTINSLLKKWFIFEGMGNPKQEKKKIGEIGGFTTPTYPPKPQFLFSIVFKTVFLIILTETHNYNLSSITT